MPTRYGRSPWIDLFPKSRVPVYPKHRGPLTIDVAIVGGGLTGCAAAYACAAAGMKVALFEAAQLGRGGSGSSSGWIAQDPGLAFSDVERLVGLRRARHAWQAWRRAALDFTALIRRLDLKCRLESCASLHVASTPEQSVALKREQKMRKAAGLDAVLANAAAVSREVGLAASTGLRTRDDAVIDPYRATLGLAAAAVDRGARIFEGSPVVRIRFTRKHADVSTLGGTARVHRVIVATGMPTPLFRSLARHFWFKSTYMVLTDPVPGRIRAQLGSRSSVIRDSATSPHVVRWVDDERLLVGGADADAVPSRLREKTIVQRTGQLMYELSTIYPDISGVMPAYGWESSYALTGDGLPYIGPHRNFPHHLFVFGDSSRSITASYLASRILLRYWLNETTPADEAFGFTR